MPGTAEPDFDLVNQQHDAVLAADRFNSLEEAWRRHDVASVALHWFDDDAGRVLGRADGSQDVVLEVVEHRIAGIAVVTEHWPVGVRVWDLDHIPAGAGLRLGGVPAESGRPRSLPVVPANKGDHSPAAGSERDQFGQAVISV